MILDITNDKNKSGIYAIKNCVNGKLYIGSTKNFEKRYKHHLYNLSNNIHCNNKLQRSYIKYGAFNFKFQILEIVEDTTELFNRELYWINKEKPFYNILLVPGEYKRCINKKKYMTKKSLCDEDVIQIILLLNDGFSIEKISKECGISGFIIRSIKKGKTYKHLTHLLELPEEDFKNFISEYCIYKIAYSISIRHPDKRIHKIYKVPYKVIKYIRKEYNEGNIKIPDEYILKD